MTVSYSFLVTTQNTAINAIVTIANMSSLMANQRGTPSEYYVAMILSFMNL